MQQVVEPCNEITVAKIDNLIGWNNVYKKIQKWPLLTLQEAYTPRLVCNGCGVIKEHNHVNYTNSFFTGVVVRIITAIKNFKGSYVIVGPVYGYKKIDVYFHGDVDIKIIIEEHVKIEFKDSYPWSINREILSVMNINFHLCLYNTKDQVIGNVKDTTTRIAFDGYFFLFTPLWAMANMAKVLIVDNNTDEIEMAHAANHSVYFVDTNTLVKRYVTSYNPQYNKLYSHILDSLKDDITIPALTYYGLFNSPEYMTDLQIKQFIYSYKGGITDEYITVLKAICGDKMADDVVYRIMHTYLDDEIVLDDVYAFMRKHFDAVTKRGCSDIVVSKFVPVDSDAILPMIFDVVNKSGLSDQIKEELFRRIEHGTFSKEKWWKI